MSPAATKIRNDIIANLNSLSQKHTQLTVQARTGKPLGDQVSLMTGMLAEIINGMILLADYVEKSTD